MARCAGLGAMCLLAAAHARGAAAIPAPVPALEDTAAAASTSSSTPAYVSRLRIIEPGFDAKLTLELYYEPGFLPFPAAAGHVLLVRASQSEGKDAFFIPSDLALELGAKRVCRVEAERASDRLGQALGGRLRPGETQFGFIVIPEETGLTTFLPEHPESIVVRYAHHRAPWRRATSAEIEAAHGAADRPAVAAALNLWWEWMEDMAKAPGMTETEVARFTEMMFPGQEKVLAEEKMRPETLRSAILRFGDRRLQEGPVRRRVAPVYPAPARQVGVEGLVIVLAYVTAEGKVGDATLLASNTAHLLNLAALSAAMEWEFALFKDATGKAIDGWRLLPFQFKLDPGARARADTSDTTNTADSTGTADTTAAGDLQPPRIVHAVTPEYSQDARERRLEGTVIYRVQVDARGKLVKAVLVQAVHPILDNAALSALERTLFLPATRNGKPVAGEITVPYVFGTQNPKKTNKTKKTQ